MTRLIDQILARDWRSRDDIKAARGLVRMDEVEPELGRMLSLRSAADALVAAGAKADHAPLRRMIAELAAIEAGLRADMAALRSHENRDRIMPLFDDVVPVLADDVAAFAFAQPSPVLFRDWDLKVDYPVLSPPFPRTFVEWHWPDAVIEARVDDLDTRQIRIPRVGLLVLGGRPDTVGDCPVPGLYRQAVDYRHWLAFKPFWCGPGSGVVTDLPGFGGLLLDGLGRVVGEPRLPRRSDNSDDVFFRMLCAVGLLAVSFMHCRGGVQVRDVEPPPRLQAARARRGRAPLVRYKTVVIDGLRELIRGAEAEGAGGLKRALHLVRGHFACYADKPLFGHYRGTVFRAAHTRGRNKAARVVKDYTVKPGGRPTAGPDDGATIKGD